MYIMKQVCICRFKRTVTQIIKFVVSTHMLLQYFNAKNWSVNPAYTHLYYDYFQVSICRFRHFFRENCETVY
jgi:hypothetical protein